jgi:hypothetical protein
MCPGRWLAAHSRLRKGQLEQRADKRQKAVVNRVFEARANRQRHRPVRHAALIIDRGPQRGKITRATFIGCYRDYFGL